MVLVEIFSDMGCLEDNVSWNCQTPIQWLNPFNRDHRCDHRWLRGEDMQDNFHFSC